MGSSLSKGPVQSQPESEGNTYIPARLFGIRTRSSSFPSHHKFSYSSLRTDYFVTTNGRVGVLHNRVHRSLLDCNNAEEDTYLQDYEGECTMQVII